MNTTQGLQERPKTHIVVVADDIVDSWHSGSSPIGYGWKMGNLEIESVRKEVIKTQYPYWHIGVFLHFVLGGQEVLKQLSQCYKCILTVHLATKEASHKVCVHRQRDDLKGS